MMGQLAVGAGARDQSAARGDPLQRGGGRTVPSARRAGYRRSPRDSRRHPQRRRAGGRGHRADAWTAQAAHRRHTAARRRRAGRRGRRAGSGRCGVPPGEGGGRRAGRSAATVRGDRVHLQQVLLNLILNGMDALDGASPEDRRVSVTARRDGARASRSPWATPVPAFPPTALGQIFDPFFTTKPDGMGMGLAISAHHRRSARREALGREPGTARRSVPLHAAHREGAAAG